MTSAAPIQSSSSRPLALRKRTDLVCRCHQYQARTTWVVKDPLGLKYFQMLPQEYAVLQMLDGSISLKELHARFRGQFPGTQITLNELQQLIAGLHQDGLVVSSHAGQGTQLFERSQKKRNSQRLSACSNLLAIRFRGLDPQRWLDAIYPVSRWLFTQTAVVSALGLCLAALLLVAVQFQEFQSRLPAFQEFFGPHNWLLLAAVLGSVKVLHEFGHGLVCRKYHGECHEMGFMLLVFTPCLYCNVSDSCLLPSKWQRAAIGAAGMYVELLLASIATFLWWNTQPGLLNNVCLQIMFVCSVSTLVFNGNPLLRYDGYYILSDLLEIPNLQKRSKAAVDRWLSAWCLGIENPPEPFAPAHSRIWLVCYAVAASIYRWVVFFSILMFLNQWLEPYGLKVLGQTLAVVAVVVMLVQPVQRTIRFFKTPGRTDSVKCMHVWGTGLVLIAVSGFVALLPLPHYVNCAIVVEPRNAETVYIGTSGVLTEVLVHAGDEVAKGQLLARQVSEDLELELAQLQGRADQYKSELQSLAERRFQDPNIGEQIASTEAALASIEAQLVQKQHAVAQLELRAPKAGTVLPVAKVAESHLPDGTLRRWNGSLLEARNLQAFAQQGDEFCQIGDEASLQAELYVDQGDVELVQVGQPTYLKFAAWPSELFTSSIDALSVRDAQAAPPSLSQQHGGALATHTNKAGLSRPLSTAYSARVALNADPGQLNIGMRGSAKIETSSLTLGARLWRSAWRTFRFAL